MRNEELIAARKRLNKTQPQVARAIGNDITAYQRYEYGTRTPSVLTALRIAEALGTTVEALWGRQAHTGAGAAQPKGVSQKQ